MDVCYGKSCGDSSSPEARSDPVASRKASRYVKDEGISKRHGLVAWYGCGIRVRGVSYGVALNYTFRVNCAQHICKDIGCLVCCYGASQPFLISLA